MTAPPDDTTPDTSAIIAALRAERDAALAREAALAEELAARTAELADRKTEFDERIEHQSATIDVLKMMSASSGDAQPVFDLIVRHATELCDVPATTLAEYDGELVHIRSFYGVETVAAASSLAVYQGLFPMRPTRGSIGCRAILDRRIIHIRDLEADHELAGFVRELGHRSQVSVPLIRNGLAIGVISITAREPGGFSDSQIELLKTFAEQAVIAITSAETYRALEERTAALAARNSEYGERIEQQSATIDVLKVMSSSPGNAQPVFQLIVERAREFCDADQANLALLDGDLLHLEATSGSSASYRAQFPRPVDVTSTFGRAIIARNVMQTPDVLVDPDHFRRTANVEATVRAVVAVPLLRRGAPVGAIAMGRNIPGEFSATQMELLKTFAEQAVIAITSAETYRALQTRTSDLQETLEYQTATSNVLKVISQSTFDLQPVLDTVTETAAQLCDADQAVIARREGELMRLVANHGFPPEYEAIVRGQGAYPIDRAPRNAGPRAIREGRIVHVHDAAAEPGYTDAAITLGEQRTSLGVPLLREGEAIGAIVLARQRVEPFTDRQIELVSTFADQAVIAIENTRLITEQRETLEQQTATAEVLQVINASPGELVPVFDAMLEKATQVCSADAGVLCTFDGEYFFPVALRGFEKFPKDRIRPHPETGIGRLARGEEIVHILDSAVGEAYQSGDPGRRSIVQLGGARTQLTAALRQEGRLIGSFTLWRREVRAFTDKQTALLENFAAQAVIAMENARLLTEQREALEQQTATAEVLQVINSSPGNLAPVFDAILEKAHSRCGATKGAFVTFDGQHFLLAATRGLSEAFAQVLRDAHQNRTPRDELRPSERLASGADMVQLTGPALLDGPIGRAGAELEKIRSVLFVALRRHSELLGYITAYRENETPFTDKQIALLQNFGAQAVIAMENARLITETRDALEHQTATAEVLQVINSSPGDLTPVFDAILEKAHSLCGAATGSLQLCDSEFFRAVATRGLPEELANILRQPRRSGIRDAFLHEAPFVQITDIADPVLSGDDKTLAAVHDIAGVRTLLRVPLRKDDALLGVIIAGRREVRPFSQQEISLLQNFAAQAVIAMENARLLEQIRQRQGELHITFENMGDGVALFDEAPRLVAWNRHFQEMFNLPDDLLEQHRTYEEHLRFLAARGDFGSGLDTEEQLRTLLTTTDQPSVYERTRPDGRVLEIRRNPVPDGGFVLIFSDITERKRSEEEIRAARDAAEEASRTIEAAYRDLKAAQANLIQAEKMASLGQLTAGIAHEIKNPLNFVNNFAALSVDLLNELKETAAPGFAALTEKQRAEVEEVSVMLTSNLEKITEHGKRADGIVKAMLEHSRGSSGERRMVDLNALIDEALNLAYHGARAQDQSFNITLERDFGTGIAPIEVNPQDITRVFLNLFANGFYATTRRARDDADAGFVPTLKVTTREAGEAVEIRVRDNGTGIPTDIRDKLFQPFFTTKPTGEGTGLGLSITYDIITQQHGGSIAVDSMVGDYSEFTIQLPRNP